MNEERDPIIQEINPPNKFSPRHIFEQMPGIDPQKKRSFFLKAKYLLPISFVNVILSFQIRLTCFLIFFSIVRYFFMNLIMEHLPGIAAFVLLGSIAFGIYNWAIQKNAEDLKEELTLSNYLTIVQIGLSIFVVTTSAL